VNNKKQNCGELLHAVLLFCSVSYFKTLWGRTPSIISMEFAVSDSELYLDNDSAFLQRVEKTGALSKGALLRKS
jgi:hypothetical protein